MQGSFYAILPLPSWLSALDWAPTVHLVVRPQGAPRFLDRGAQDPLPLGLCAGWGLDEVTGESKGPLPCLSRRPRAGAGGWRVPTPQAWGDEDPGTPLLPAIPAGPTSQFWTLPSASSPFL